VRLDPASGVKLDEGLSLAESYELCRQIQKAHSRTYYFSTGFFPPHVRPRVHALYAFMRYADEIVDNPGVVYEKVKTPSDWRDDYNLEEGAAFGIGHGILQVGYFRPPMVSRSVEGMYFVGASTRPGTGVPLVTIGARLAAERIGREVGQS